MKAKLLGLIACVALLGATPSYALTFTFSFTGVDGTVTGEIEGLVDNANGQAATVIIDSLPAALASSFASYCAIPCNTSISPWDVRTNYFDVSGGMITDHLTDYLSDGIGPGSALELTAEQGTLDFNGAAEIGVVTFEQLATPLPPAAPLFAMGLASLGLLGWRKKRKAQAA